LVVAGLRMPADQRQLISTLPMHLVDVLTVGDGAQSFVDASGKLPITTSFVTQTSGMYTKNTPPSSNAVINQGSLLQGQLPQLHDLQSQAQKFQSIPNMSATMQSQSLMPRMQVSVHFFFTLRYEFK
ncbi:hypothetical protein GIB67_032906, partial [Kingdonia uniflora]